MFFVCGVKYSQIYISLFGHSEADPLVLKKSELPARMQNCKFADLDLLFTTPDSKLCGHETPDSWVLWLQILGKF